MDLAVRKTVHAWMLACLHQVFRSEASVSFGTTHFDGGEAWA